VPQLCVGVLLQTPGLTGVIVGARNARQGSVIAGLGVGVSADQAAAVWTIADRLAKDLEAVPA
jgi:branched-subunit amino acid ABC-type transport system permease component